MKAITISACLLILTACVAIQPADPVCPTYGSWICEKSEEMGVYPETVYGWVYTASAIAAISDIIEIKEICDFEKEVADFYLRNTPISYSSFINEVLLRADLMAQEKALLIKNIINSNLLQYQSAEFISEVDDMILRKGHVAFRRDMACFDQPQNGLF